jgi:hypothetical protein
MRINSINNNSSNQKQQSFGATKGCPDFDLKLGEILGVIGDYFGHDRLAAEQAKLAKTGKDFMTQFDNLTVTTSPKGERIHPVVSLLDIEQIERSDAPNCSVFNFEVKALDYFKKDCLLWTQPVFFLNFRSPSKVLNRLLGGFWEAADNIVVVKRADEAKAASQAELHKTLRLGG